MEKERRAFFAITRWSLTINNKNSVSITQSHLDLGGGTRYFVPLSVPTQENAKSNRVPVRQTSCTIKERDGSSAKGEGK